MPCVDRRVFVHLAYLDDSGTRDKDRKFQLLSAVIIDENAFVRLEGFAALSAEAIIPHERLDKFEEFHACELYGGYGVFDGVEQEKRFLVITGLLNIVAKMQIPVVYGAVDKLRLADKHYGSADPLDICFRFCVEGIER